MGIEHRLKESDEESFWKCPHCEAVQDFSTKLGRNTIIPCGECGDGAIPFDHTASWEDFWEYCRKIKGDK